MDRSKAIKDALGAGYKLGYRGSLATIGNQPIANILVPPEHAGAWMVNLLPMIYLTAPGGAPQDPLFPPWGGATVLVQWGTGDAADEAIIDYPIRGASFSVCGAWVRITMRPNLTTAVGDVSGGGMITPTDAAIPNGDTQDWGPFRSEEVAVGALATVPVTRPDHAVAYSISGVTHAVPQMGAIDLTQRTGPGGGTVVTDHQGGAPWPINGTLKDSFWLHPAAGVIVMSNNGGTNFNTIVRWRLRLS